MILRKANPDHLRKIIDLYRGKSKEEIQSIKPKWAYGLNESHQLKSFEGYSIFFVNTLDLIRKVQWGEMGSKKLNPVVLFTGAEASDFRIAKALDHWSKSLFIDPPELVLGGSGGIYIADGRHRSIAAFHLGEETIPVAVPDEQIQEVSLIIGLKRLGVV